MALLAVTLAAVTLVTPEPWLAGLGSRPSKARVEASAACGGGLGVFATEALTPGEELCSIPLAACLSINDAAEYTDAVLAFYRSYNPRFLTWAKAARIIFAMAPSSAASERVFSLVKNMFGKDQPLAR